MAFPARRRDRPAESQASPRAEWYDRNPITRTLAYFDAGIPPHAPTVRASYTVPTGKRAFIEAMHVRNLRVTAPTAADIAAVYVTHTPSGGTLIWLLGVRWVSSTVNYEEWASQGLSGVLVAGDVVDIRDFDWSTGGLVCNNEGAKITEFDA